MPHIEVDDDVYEQLTALARRWRLTHGQAVTMLIRLYVQPFAHHPLTLRTGRRAGSPGARP